jgi:hypothetical protein
MKRSIIFILCMSFLYGYSCLIFYIKFFGILAAMPDHNDFNVFSFIS